MKGWESRQDSSLSPRRGKRLRLVIPPRCPESGTGIVGLQGTDWSPVGS